MRLRRVFKEYFCKNVGILSQSDADLPIFKGIHGFEREELEHEHAQQE